MLLVFEGPDGSGKTTVSKEMAQRLGVEWRCFPDRTTPVGKAIDGYLKGEWFAGYNIPQKDRFEKSLNALVLQGLMFANRLERLDRLRQSAHRSLVLDRYWQSGYAYGKLDGLDGDWLIRASQGLPQATLNVLLDAPVGVLVERMKARGASPEHYERTEVLEQLRTHYRQVWSWGATHQGQDVWKVVDSSGSKQETSERVWQVLLGAGFTAP